MSERIGEEIESTEKTEKEPIQTARAIPVIYNKKTKQRELLVFEVNYWEEGMAPFLNHQAVAPNSGNQTIPLDKKGKKSKRPNNPKWFIGFPWGSLKEWENPQQAVKRELEEEIGISDMLLIPLGTMGFKWHQGDILENALFLAVLPEDFKANFGQDEDEEFKGTKRIPLGQTYEEIFQNLLRVIKLWGTDFGLKIQEEWSETQKVDQIIKSSLMEALSINQISVLIMVFWLEILKDIPSEALKISTIHSFLNKNVQEVLSAFSESHQESLSISLMSYKQFEEILLSNSNPIRALSISYHPPKEREFNSEQKHSGITLDIDSKPPNIDNQTFFKLIWYLLIIAWGHLFLLGNTSNIKFIKIPKKQRETLSPKEQEKLEQIISFVLKTILQDPDLIITKVDDKKANNIWFYCAVNHEKLSSYEDIKNINFKKVLFSKPTISLLDNHTAPLFWANPWDKWTEEIEKERKNIIKQIMNTYSPTNPHKIDLTFLDLPRLKKLLPGTMKQILMIFFGIDSVNENDFKNLSLLLTKALEFYRYVLWGKIPPKVGSQKKFFDGQNFDIENFNQFIEWINYWDDTVLSFKRSLLQIAYTINYYLVHIHPIVQQAHQVKTSLESQLNDILHTVPHLNSHIKRVFIRVKEPAKIILKLLRKAEFNEKSFEDILGIQIVISWNTDEDIVSALQTILEWILVQNIWNSQISKQKLEFKGETRWSLPYQTAKEYFENNMPEGVSIIDSWNDKLDSIVYKYTYGKIPVEIMLLPYNVHRQSESGLLTHIFYDFAGKLLRVTSRLYGLIPYTTAIKLLSEYLLETHTTPYWTTLIEEMHGRNWAKEIFRELKNRWIIKKIPHIDDNEWSFSQFWKNLQSILKPNTPQYQEFQNRLKEKAQKQLGSRLSKTDIPISKIENGELISIWYTCEDLTTRYEITNQTPPKKCETNATQIPPKKYETTSEPS